MILGNFEVTYSNWRGVFPGMWVVVGGIVYVYKKAGGEGRSPFGRMFVCVISF